MRFWNNLVILSSVQSPTEQQTHLPTGKGNPVPLNNIEEIFIYLVKIGKLSRNHYRNTINLLFLIPARGRGSSYLSSPQFFLLLWVFGDLNHMYEISSLIFI